ncbi:nitroreductase/quinone reductase family protein [Mycolicibacter minnesotensis]
MAHYQPPSTVERFGNALIRKLAEAGVSIAGTRAISVRGRKSGKRRGVVINLLTVDGVDYLVSPRGNTEWVRNVRAAGEIEVGPRWRPRPAQVIEVPDDDKPEVLRRYLQRWYWQVKGYVAGLTPDSSDDELRVAASSFPVFSLR